MPAPRMAGTVPTRATDIEPGNVKGVETALKQHKVGPERATAGPETSSGRRVGKPSAVKTGNRSITDGQKGAIWTIIRKNGLDEVMFRDWLQREFGTTSTKTLSQADAQEVIRSLKVLTGEEYEPHLRGLTWGITRKQIGYIKQLAVDLGWTEPSGRVDERRIGGMIRKMFPPKNRMELLNKREATSLIIGLEKQLTPEADEVRA